MGKIKMGGTATMEFEPDYYKFSVTVNLNRSTSGEAIAQGRRRVEEILGLLQDKMKIDLSTVTLSNERTSVPYSKDGYEYEKNFYFCYEADNRITDSIVGLFEKMKDITYYISFELNNMSEKSQLVMSAAVENAREKAEKLAAALGSHVNGFEEIRYEFDDEAEEETVYKMSKSSFNDSKRSKSLASKLRSRKIEITKTVDVIWLTDK